MKCWLCSSSFQCSEIKWEFFALGISLRSLIPAGSWDLSRSPSQGPPCYSLKVQTCTRLKTLVSAIVGALNSLSRYSHGCPLTLSGLTTPSKVVFHDDRFLSSSSSWFPPSHPSMPFSWGNSLIYPASEMPFKMNVIQKQVVLTPKPPRILPFFQSSYFYLTLLNIILYLLIFVCLLHSDVSSTKSDLICLHFCILRAENSTCIVGAENWMDIRAMSWTITCGSNYTLISCW